MEKKNYVYVVAWALVTAVSNLYIPNHRHFLDRICMVSRILSATLRCLTAHGDHCPLKIKKQRNERTFEDTTTKSQSQLSAILLVILK